MIQYTIFTIYIFTNKTILSSRTWERLLKITSCSKYTCFPSQMLQCVSSKFFFLPLLLPNIITPLLKCAHQDFFHLSVQAGTWKSVLSVLPHSWLEDLSATSWEMPELVLCEWVLVSIEKYKTKPPIVELVHCNYVHTSFLLFPGWKEIYIQYGKLLLHFKIWLRDLGNFSFRKIVGVIIILAINCCSLQAQCLIGWLLLQYEKLKLIYICIMMTGKPCLLFWQALHCNILLFTGSYL